MHTSSKIAPILNTIKIGSLILSLLFFNACDDDESTSQDGNDYLVSYERLYTINGSTFAFAASSIPSLNAIDGLSSANDVTGYSITYNSVAPDGDLVTASALVTVPSDDGAPIQNVPLLSLQHGTIFNDSGRPSKPRTLSDILGGDVSEGIVEAGLGYFTINPDGIGFGASIEKRRPYIYGTGYQLDGVTALRAAQELAAELGVTLDGRIFLKGYSEGGYATVALQSFIESNPELYDEFPLTAVAAGAGPYDILLTGQLQFSGLYTDGSVNKLTDPGYFPFVARAYEEYANIDNPYSYYFAEEYASIIPELYEGAELSGGQINAQLSDVVSELMDPDFLSGFLGNGEAELKALFEEQSFVDGWDLKTPTTFYHCSDDITVPPQNAQNIYDNFVDDYPDLVALENEGNFLVGETDEDGELLIDPSEDPGVYHSSCQYIFTPINWFGAEF